jgi:glycosyltransferase involved in cell wall biosynthesis
MKIVLFDWTADGHHPSYLNRFATSLSAVASVTAAIPDCMAHCINSLPVEIFSLGAPRPYVDKSGDIARQNKTLATEELDLLAHAVSVIRPDHVIHLYSDPVIRRLVPRKGFGSMTSLFIFFPRAHYPAAYRSTLPPKELLRAWFLEYLIMRWRRRSDAHALFSLDPVAVRRWGRLPGAPSYWVPEPPIDVELGSDDGNRSGCLVYGVLSPRKGIDWIERAVAEDGKGLRITFAGPVEPGFEEDFNRRVDRMTRAGADVDVRSRIHSELEGLQLMAQARCVLVTYKQHYTMSRVLLEAASVGTPVVAHRYGLVGDLVNRHGLGTSIDCSDASLLNGAMREFTHDKVLLDRERLAKFTEQYSHSAFEKAVRAPFFQY